VTNGISEIGKDSIITRRFLQLKDLRAAANRMGMCLAIGIVAIRGYYNGTVVGGDIIDFNRGCRDAFRRYFQDFALGGDVTAQIQLAIWQKDPIVQQVLQNIAIVSNFHQGLALNSTDDDWSGNVTHASDVLDQMSEVLLADLRQSQDLYDAVVSEGTKLGVTQLRRSPAPSPLSMPCSTFS
jgi:hypothetical protein